ncbi:MAG: DUF3794 domain-containing protein [Thermoanaerobacteraceae bacterium]|nr:DUF3794 domain-containing protein [Thermoanaerobacteraceae bacterium]
MQTDTISYDKLIGKEDSQALVENDIIVPEDEPDVLNVIAVNALTIINDIEADEEKIHIDGELRLNILYTPDKEGTLIKIDKSIDFSHFFEVEGCDSKCRALVVARVEHVDYSVINSRKINIKAILSISSSVFSKEMKDIVVNIEDIEDMEYLKKTIKYLNTIGQNDVETFLKEQIKIPDGAPEIDRIIKIDTIIKSDEYRITDNRVMIQGNIHAVVLYTTKNKGEFEKLECDLNYDSFIEIPGALSYMNAKTYEAIIEKNVEVLEDDNGENRILNIELVVKTNAVVTEIEEREIPVDVYSITRNIEPEREIITTINRSVGTTSQVILKEAIELKNNARKIIDRIAYPVISNYTMSDKKVLIEGVIDYNAMYLNDEGYINSSKGEFPFKTFVDVQNDVGVPFLDLKISHVSYEIIAMKEVELKFIMDVYVDIFYEESFDVLTDIKEVEEARYEKNKHSITIYMVQKNDNLWDIAKKYRTSKDEILNINEITDEKLIAGTKLIIPIKAQ